jgi:hypothetical protein
MQDNEMPNWLLVSCAIAPLKIIKDLHEKELLSAFSGDPGKQFEILHEWFKKNIIEAHLLDKVQLDDDAVLARWITALERLE